MIFWQPGKKIYVKREKNLWQAGNKSTYLTIQMDKLKKNILPEWRDNDRKGKNQCKQETNICLFNVTKIEISY